MKSKDTWNKYPGPNNSAAIGAQFSLTPASSHGHTGAALDGNQIRYSNILDAPTSFASPVYGGRVESNVSTSFYPSGWSLTHTGTGIYTITHNFGNKNYAIAVTPDVSGEAYCIFGYAILDVNTLQVWFNNPDAGFAFQNQNFDFIITTQANP